MIRSKLGACSKLGSLPYSVAAAKSRWKLLCRGKHTTDSGKHTTDYRRNGTSVGSEMKFFGWVGNFSIKTIAV